MQDDRERLAADRARWEKTTLAKSLERLPERRSEFTTISGVQTQRLYEPGADEVAAYQREIGFPGEYPFTRGVHPTMYRGRLWTMRLFAGFGAAEETNERFKYLLSHGESGLSVAFDMPTLYGLDTDDPQALGEFGKCGVAVSSLADMEILFDGIRLDEVTTSMTINGPAAIIWAMYLVTAEKQGIPFGELGGTLQNDILKEYTAQKEFLFPPEPALKLVIDTIEFGSRHLPKWNTVSISGYHIREAGSTAAQELAFTLADGIAYVQASLDRGLAVDDFAPRLSFFFNAHSDFFEEIAKYRAARRLWAKITRQRFGAKDPRSWMLRFHTQTAGCSLTAQQPENNVVRVTLQALAAVLGGTQSLHTNSMDEALALPSESAVRVALRTQQIIANESGVTNTVDPLGGSYFVEALTNELERQAREYIERIDRLGGMVAAIGVNYPQQEIAEASFRYQQEVESGERIVVGVNGFTTDEPVQVPLLRMDPEGERRQLARLAEVRRRRDRAQAERCLRALSKAAAAGENVMPYLLDAVRAYCTLGEMTQALREVYGSYMEVPVL